MFGIKFAAVSSEDRARLEELINRGKNHVFTPQELFEQEVSWIYSMLGGDVKSLSKDQVRRMLQANLAYPGQEEFPIHDEGVSAGLWSSLVKELKTWPVLPEPEEPAPPVL